MNILKSSKIINSNEKHIIDTKISNNIKNENIYSKIAPPNTFKRKNQNQILRGSKIFKRKEQSPNSNRILNPLLRNSNFIKNNSISKSNVILNDFNINKSYVEKAKLLKGNIIYLNNNINNNNNFIITPKKMVFTKVKIDGNKIDFNKYKTEKQNNSNNKTEEEIDAQKINVMNKYKNIKKQLNYQNISIKEKYDLLLQKTKKLLSNYQNIVDYYQEKEKEKNINFNQK